MFTMRKARLCLSIWSVLAVIHAGSCTVDQ